MPDVKKLQENFQKNIAALQANCKHENTTDWMKSDFLGGIPTVEFKKCNICGKITARRTRCWTCGVWVEQPFEEPFWIQGDGSEKLPIGTVFCCEIHKRWYVQTARALGREVPSWIGRSIGKF